MLYITYDEGESAGVEGHEDEVVHEDGDEREVREELQPLVVGQPAESNQQNLVPRVTQTTINRKGSNQSINQSTSMLEIKTVFAWLSQNFFINL